MSAEDGRIRLALVHDVPAHADYFRQLTGWLRETGEVEPVLLICHDQAPDPDWDIPFVRIREAGEGEPRHAYDVEDLTGYERFIAWMDPYFEGRYEQAALSLCAGAERYFAAGHASAALVLQGTRLTTRAVAAAAKQCGAAVVYQETPYFQRLPEPPERDVALTLNRMVNHTFIWDTVQAPQCGPSQLTRDWPKADTRPGLDAFFARIQADRVAKFSREDINRFLGPEGASRSRHAQDVLVKPPGTRALLVCGQVDRDSSMYYQQHALSTWYALGAETAKRLPPGWVMWFKGHPLDRAFADGWREAAAEFHALNPHCLTLPPDMDIHACYRACGAVCTINSTAGIEAMTYGRPVVTLGRAAYTHSGMTISLDDLEALGPAIADLPEHMTPEQCRVRDQFLSYVLYEYLVPAGSPSRGVARIRQAMRERQGA